MIVRIFRVVRTPLTLLILLGFLVWGAWWGYTNILRPIPPLPPEPCVQQTLAKGQLTTGQVVVRVFNGGDRKGLAAEVGRSLRNKGFRVTLTTNTVEKVSKTVIVGADVRAPEVLFVKTFFKEAAVRADERADHTVDVLVGNKYSGFNKNAKTTYAVGSDTACLPSQSPTATPGAGN